MRGGATGELTWGDDFLLLLLRLLIGLRGQQVNELCRAQEGLHVGGGGPCKGATATKCGVHARGSCEGATAPGVGCMRGGHVRGPQPQVWGACEGVM